MVRRCMEWWGGQLFLGAGHPSTFSPWIVDFSDSTVSCEIHLKYPGERLLTCESREWLESGPAPKVPSSPSPLVHLSQRVRARWCT